MLSVQLPDNGKVKKNKKQQTLYSYALKSGA